MRGFFLFFFLSVPFCLFIVWMFSLALLGLGELEVEREREREGLGLFWARWGGKGRVGYGGVG